MPENPFHGSWGFVNKPVSEPDQGFLVFTTETPDVVRIEFRPSGDTTEGSTPGDVLEFIHKLPAGGAIRYYFGRIVIKTPPECTASDCIFSIATGKAQTFRHLRDAEQASANPLVRITDEDWIGNRPA